MLKNCCRRLERAEFYKIWPPQLFMVGVSFAQIAMYGYHKAYYKHFFGKQGGNKDLTIDIASN